MYTVGIDIGTSTICGVVCDPAGTCLRTITRINDTSLASPNPWERVQDPDAIVAIVEEMLAELFRDYPDIRSVGVTGQMHGMLYVDGAGRAASPLYTWQDGRGNLPYRDGRSYAEHLSACGGRRAATGWGLVTHFYNLRNNRVPAGAVKLCTVMDYAVMRLTGNTSPVMDATNGASLGFFDARKRRFERENMRRAGIDPSILPDLAAPSVPAGICRGSVRVFPAIGDNQAAFLGSVDDLAGSIHITVGTSSQLSVYSEEYREVEGVETRPMPGGGYLLVGASLCGGEAFALLKGFFQETLRLFGHEAPDEMYAAMIASAADADDDPPTVETLFRGTRPEPFRRGSVSGISAANFTPGKLARGFLQGIVTELYGFHLLLPPDIRARKTQLIGAGNGLKKNPLLAALLGQRFALPLSLTQRDEAAAFGACAIHRQTNHH